MKGKVSLKVEAGSARDVADLSEQIHDLLKNIGLVVYPVRAPWQSAGARGSGAWNGRVQFETLVTDEERAEEARTLARMARVTKTYGGNSGVMPDLSTLAERFSSE